LGSDSDFIIVLTTFPVDGDVTGVARILIAEKLAACVNVLPAMRSIYSWKGAIENSDEHQLVIKTTDARREELESRLKSLHPYQTPEFLVIPIVAGSPGYLAWLAENTSK
jgi:periplasmic divalent cation tolerance protein